MKEAWNPLTGKKESARWVSNRFGEHRFGVKFLKGGEVFCDTEIDKLEERHCKNTYENRLVRSPWAVIRILGNALPPRDIPGMRNTSLKFIVETEPDLAYGDKLWVLNKLTDKELESQYLNSLHSTGEPLRLMALDFDEKEYLAAGNFDEKIQACISINKARNTALKWAFGMGYSWAIVMDGDCMWTEDAWDLFLSRHALDQRETRHQRKYYTATTIRSYLDDGVLMATSEFTECHPAFAWNSELRFDEGLVFGRAEKQTLLRLLGHDIPGYENQWKTSPNALTACIGEVYHIGTGNERAERDVNVRVALRQASLQQHFDWLDKSLQVPACGNIFNGSKEIQIT